MPRLMYSIRLRLIVLFLMATTMTMGMIAIYEQRVLAQQLESHFNTLQKDVVARLQQSLAEPVWALDLKLIDAKLEAALQPMEVSAIILTAPDGAEVYAGMVRDTAGVPRASKDVQDLAEPSVEASVFPPGHIDGDRRKISIARVVVHFSRAQMDETLHAGWVRHGFEVIAMNSLLLVVLTLSLQIVFRPLRRLGDALHQLSSSHGDNVHELPVTHRIELDEVIGGFNLTLRKLKQIIVLRTEAEATARDAIAATDRAFSQLKTSQQELIEKNKQLEQLAVTDTLTSLCNRLKLDQVLASEVDRHLRYGKYFALVMLDIDHFKAVNDKYGHPVGDQVLVELARVLTRETRTVDCVGRWGGEEFLVICPDTDLRGGVDFAEKLRQAVADHPFPVIGRITVSLGVTSAHPGDTVQLMVARADEALYRSKHNGRNKVESSR